MVPAVELGKFALVMSFAKDLRRLWVKVKVRVGLVMSVLPYIYDADGLGLVYYCCCNCRAMPEDWAEAGRGSEFRLRVSLPYSTWLYALIQLANNLQITP